MFLNESELEVIENETAGRWSKNEHKRFLEAIKLYGKNWQKVHKYVGTRNPTQARSHAQKYFAKLERSRISSDEFKTQEATPTTTIIQKSNLTANDDKPYNIEVDSLKDKILWQEKKKLTNTEIPETSLLNTIQVKSNKIINKESDEEYYHDIASKYDIEYNPFNNDQMDINDSHLLQNIFPYGDFNNDDSMKIDDVGIQDSYDFLFPSGFAPSL